MKRFLFIPLILALCGSALADQIITATITITNTSGTVNGETITVNGDIRTWTNSVVFPATQILTNSTIGGSATNLYLAIAAARFANLSLGQLTNGITLQTAPNAALAVSLSSGWGSAVLVTNSWTNAVALRLPITVELPAVQTNLATEAAQALESSTYAISATAPFGGNFVNLSQAQTITGQKTLVNPRSIGGGNTNGIFLNPTLTNGINFGLAFSSPGTNAGAEQFGLGASAIGNGTLAVGNSATATNLTAMAVGAGALASQASASALGTSSSATAPGATALGVLAVASGTNSLAMGRGAASTNTAATAVGYFSTAGGTNSLAIGWRSVAAFDDSVAIGQQAVTTGINQLTLGTAADYVAIPGNLAVAGNISNANFAATANFPAGSDLAFGRYALSTLANGNNAGVVVGTNVYCYLSGPTGAFTINGMAGGRNGKIVILVNRTGQNLTIANDSGVEPTSANRIYCLTGADKTVTGNSAAILIYDSALAHWIVLSFTQ